MRPPLDRQVSRARYWLPRFGSAGIDGSGTQTRVSQWVFGLGGRSVARRSRIWGRGRKADGRVRHRVRAKGLQAANGRSLQADHSKAGSGVRGAAAGAPDQPRAATKTSLRSLARRWQQLQAELDRIDLQLQALVSPAAPTLLALPGVGVDTAGQLRVTAGDNPQRLRGEAAFAHLCGVAPIPASSGRTHRHRLNRGGDRHANNALWRIALPHALPPADQGLCRAADQTRPVQARHHALLKALHRPRDLPPPHRPTSHHACHLPEIGGISSRNSTDTTERNACMLLPPVRTVSR
jgi:hypothetical protein